MFSSSNSIIMISSSSSSSSSIPISIVRFDCFAFHVYRVTASIPCKRSCVSCFTLLTVHESVGRLGKAASRFAGRAKRPTLPGHL